MKADMDYSRTRLHCCLPDKISNPWARKTFTHTSLVNQRPRLHGHGARVNLSLSLSLSKSGKCRVFKETDGCYN